MLHVIYTHHIFNLVHFPSSSFYARYLVDASFHEKKLNRKKLSNVLRECALWWYSLKIGKFYESNEMR